MSIPTESSIYCKDCNCYNISEDFCLCEECYNKRIEEINLKWKKKIEDFCRLGWEALGWFGTELIRRGF